MGVIARGNCPRATNKDINLFEKEFYNLFNLANFFRQICSWMEETVPGNWHKEESSGVCDCQGAIGMEVVFRGELSRRLLIG